MRRSAILGLVGLVAVACSGGGGSGAAADGGAGGPGAGTTDGGASEGGSSGALGEGGGGPLGANALPLTTFLYVFAETPDHDVLMAYDRVTGQARVVTDLRSDGSAGWEIGGYALSRDRTRITLASLYAPTKEDTDTTLATRRIWTLATDGSDFKRLTPVFPNTGGGKNNFVIEVSDPAFSPDGSVVYYEYGEYWYEGSSIKGGAGIWATAADGSSAPSLVIAPSPCSLLNPSPDPATGRVAVIHSVCIPGQGQEEGIYLHSDQGEPELLIGRSSGVDVSLETPRWIASGEGFSFIGVTNIDVGGTSTTARGLYAYDMTKREAAPLVVPTAPNTIVYDAAPAPDLSAIVYCLREGEATNLHLIDLSTDPATDTALTTDGKSCHPVW